VGRLQVLYDTHPDSAALEHGRAEAGAWARTELEGPVAARLRTFTIGRVPDRPVNNARLIGARIYRTRLDLFDRWYEQHGEDVGSSVAALGRLMDGVEGDSAYARLQAAVGDSVAPVRSDTVEGP
jgi:hypothetical protein